MYLFGDLSVKAISRLFTDGETGLLVVLDLKKKPDCLLAVRLNALTNQEVMRVQARWLAGETILRRWVPTPHAPCAHGRLGAA